MKEGMIERIIFGIVTPSPPNLTSTAPPLSHKKTQENNSQRESLTYADIGAKKTYNGMKKSGSDQLVESYAFDVCRGSPVQKKGKNNHTQIRDTAEALLRNLNGFSSTLPPLIVSYTSSQDDATVEYSEAANWMQSLASDSIGKPKIPPTSRYLTLRVEFTRSAPLGYRPLALDSSSPLFSLENFTNSHAEADPGKGHGTIGEKLGILVPTELGKVGDENTSGVAVSMAAFCADDEYELDHEQQNKEEEENNSHFEKDRENSIEELTLSASSNVHGICEDETSVVSPIKPLPIESRAFAIPYCLGKTKDIPYIPCTILDRKLEDKDKYTYKVEFACKRLKKKRKMKQWVRSERVIPADIMLQRINSALKERLSDSKEEKPLSRVREKVIEEMAENLHVKPKLIMAATQAIQNQIELEDISNNDDSNEDSSESRRHVSSTEEDSCETPKQPTITRAHEDKSDLKLRKHKQHTRVRPQKTIRYSYIAKPIHTYI